MNEINFKENSKIEINKKKILENSICQIEYNNNKGIGFLCKYQSESNILPLLFINIHFLKENEINNNITINLIYKGEIRKIKLNKSRKIFIIKEFGIILIKIKPNKEHIKLNSFLELDNTNYQDNQYYNNIYSKQCIYKFDKNKKNDLLYEKKIIHQIIPILSNNYKIIGIEDFYDKYFFNKNIFEKYYYNKFKFTKENKLNKIIIRYLIKEKKR